LTAKNLMMLASEKQVNIHRTVCLGGLTGDLGLGSLIPCCSDGRDEIRERADEFLAIKPISRRK